MSHLKFSSLKILIPMLASGILLIACGGGGSSLSDVGSGGTGFISGNVTAGPVSGANVVAYAVMAGQLGAQIGKASTDASGSFTMNVGSYAGPVMLQANGGSYTDEATGTVMPIATGDVMTAIVPAIAAGSSNAGVQITPLTAMAQSRAMGMSGGMTDANIAAANAAIGNYFSVSDILHTQPMNPIATGSGASASQDARNYGMTLAAMSEYAKSLTMPVSSTLVTYMMQDATDGVMNGKNGMTQISMSMGAMMGPSMMAPTAGTKGLADAMTSFMKSSANLSGLTLSDMQALIQKLNSSGGQI